MACTPEELIEQAKTMCCIPPNAHIGVQNYILAHLRGGSMNVDEIIRESSCVSRCIPPGLLKRIKTYLLCQLSNTSGETPIPEPVCDEDAQAFIDAAGITDEDQQGAICRFVAALKNNGTPAFWDSEIIIYPFVGGNATSHSFNLRDPTTYQLTYGGVPAPTHSNLGIIGNGSTAYAITGYVPNSSLPSMPLNNCRCYCYFNQMDLTNARVHFGTTTDAFSRRLYCYNHAASVRTRFQLTEAATYVAMVQFNGGYLMQTPDGIARNVAFNGGAFNTPAWTKTDRSRGIVLLLCENNNAVAPAITPGAFVTSTLSGWSIGSRALSAAEWPIYQRIWQDYQTELGRQKP